MPQSDKEDALRRIAIRRKGRVAPAVGGGIFTACPAILLRHTSSPALATRRINMPPRRRAGCRAGTAPDFYPQPVQHDDAFEALRSLCRMHGRTCHINVIYRVPAFMRFLGLARPRWNAKLRNQR